MRAGALALLVALMSAATLFLACHAGPVNDSASSKRRVPDDVSGPVRHMNDYLDFLHRYMQSVSRPRFGKRGLWDNDPFMQRLRDLGSRRYLTEAEAYQYMADLSRYLQLVVGRPRFG